jgi:hypothetical protein
VSVTGLRAKNPESTNVGQATITTDDGRRIFGGAANRDGKRRERDQPGAQ